MEQLPLYIPVIFLLTAALSVFLFYMAAGKSNLFLTVILIWLGIQTVICLNGFYLVTKGFPPRFVLLVGPALLSMLMLFILPAGKLWLNRLDIKKLTLLHLVRIPVELVLYWLFLEKGIPKIMTFEGWNFDILSGLSAGAVYYFAFVRNKIGRIGLIVWNVICLILVMVIVCLAALSAPSDFQQLAFDQPNIAVFYFPYFLLPGCIVPLVFLSHLAALRNLILRRTN